RLNKPVKRILIVDDNPDMLQLLTRMLLIIDRTYEITKATNGTMALATLRQMTENGAQPDLILMDILMPELLGWQVLEIKNHDDTIRDIPVIVVSGEELVEEQTNSPLLITTMGTGLSVNQLLRFSHELTTLLLQSDETF
ncbi:MAG: response regulator, partial [Chloroflexota bacterium]